MAKREASPVALSLDDAARASSDQVLAKLGSSVDGLDDAEAARRLEVYGPNAVRSHGARPLTVLVRQLANPLLILLVSAAGVSFAVGQRTDGAIILSIIALSVGLGFINEYRSELAVEALHSRIRHRTVVVRGGRTTPIDVTELVPGDVVRLNIGDVVPADVRLLDVNGLECDEAVLTGESVPAEKSAVSATDEATSSCALMGTVVQNGTATGVVVRTGPLTDFGKIAAGLGSRPAQTAFQRGLSDYSKLLVRVTGVLSLSIFGINIALHRPFLDAALFALAIAVGLTPQLLPAIVTISLSTGAHRMAQRSVVVKRLVAIEDLGNIEILFTDKTGTLTEGRITFAKSVDAHGNDSSDVTAFGLVCGDAVVRDGAAVAGSQLDVALWSAPNAAALAGRFTKLADVPFDYERRLVSALIADATGHRRIVCKGAPESVLARCATVPDDARATLDALFDQGARVVAVASKETSQSSITASDEHGLTLAGFLTFVDPPKQDAAASIDRLNRLGIVVKIVTGDNDRVARKVCETLGMPVDGVLTGDEIEKLSDAQLLAAIAHTTVFARVAPDQKSRIIRAQRGLHKDVAFLGDGVNDAVALHDADVGISVESAADVAKDAAHIVLLTKDLGVLADGVVEGRRIFANTIKYVLMGTSSNFGNMFSAAGASLFLKFLPMLPTQILLNNLLYDVSEMTIPSDEVDEELLERPAQWDTRFIRRFMLFFGPISSIYDFLTFGVMIFVFHAGPMLFHTAWFVESLSTQTLVIFVIRTRRVPFTRSRPSTPLAATTIGCVLVGVALPFSPLAHVLGFRTLPWAFLLILLGMIATYLMLAELGVAYFFRPVAEAPPLERRLSRRERRVNRRAERWTRGRRI